MPDDKSTEDNFDRLLSHLKDGSFAAQLVAGYRNPGEVTPAESLKQVILDRLDHVRGNLERSKN